jgi:hypothetical protein
VARGQVPYNPCENVGCVDCLGILVENTLVSCCSCPHHKDDFEDSMLAPIEAQALGGVVAATQYRLHSRPKKQ